MSATDLDTPVEAEPTAEAQPTPVDERLAKAVRRQARTLALLHETSSELTSILDRRVLLDRLTERLGELIDYRRLTVFLWHEASGYFEAISTRCRGGCTLRGEDLPAGHGIVGAAAELRQPVRVDDVGLDPRYVSCAEDPADDPVRAELAVPLVFKERLVGVLDLESYEIGGFCAADERLLATLASYLAVALENSRLYARLEADERALARDLQTARQIQKRLLPRTTPWLPGLQTAAVYAPARHLGGDLYDVLPCGPGRIMIVVGDVAGKGAGAALYSSLAIGMVRAFVGERRAGGREATPREVLDYLNQELAQLEIRGRSLALACAIYDAPRGTLTVADAGLPYPLLLRAGGLEEIELPGLPLGAMRRAEYRETRVELRPGDVVVFLSDGFVECLDRCGEPFGARRVRRTLESLAGGSARTIADGLLAATESHLGDRREASDDRTAVVLRLSADPGLR